MADTKALSGPALTKAAGEIRGFMSLFKVLAVVAEGLEEAAGLENHLPKLRREAESILSEARGQASEAAAKVAELRLEEATLRARVEKGRADAVAAAEELRTVEAQLLDRQKVLSATRARIAEIARLAGDGGDPHDHREV